ncbi:MAG TPA: hypothetical protein VJ623_12360 [Holophagaceae bacterium]|nr:hypothetical protein [Holophagaceae bacterium]
MDAWVLFDRTEFAYRGDGEIRKKQYRIVQVFTDRAASECVFIRHGLGKGASRVAKLKGWNLRDDGHLYTVDKDYLITADLDSGAVTSEQGALAVLPGVRAGSIVAWESSEQIRHPMGPQALTYIMEPYPIGRYELEWGTGNWFTGGSNAVPHLAIDHFDGWFKSPVERTESRIRIQDVPPIPRDWVLAPDARNALPWVSVRFEDAKLQTLNPRTWDDVARWYSKTFGALAEPLLPEGMGKGEGRDGLVALGEWMRKELAYRQVYLDPTRGWVPVSAKETHRRRFGDCKDLTMAAIAGAKGLGFEAVPVLCRVANGRLESQEPPSAFAFNHVIAAIRLDHGLGFPAEVDTPSGRFLLFDPTQRTTPLGQMPISHAGRSLLMCLPEGGVWINVPEGALEPAGIEADWEGTLETDGSLKGTLVLLERGNAWGLRETLESEGERGLQEMLPRRLHFPVDADWSLLVDSKTRRAVDLEVRIRVEMPRGGRLEPEQGQYRLPLTLPLPPPAARFGVAAPWPLEWGAPPSLTLRARTTFPWDLSGRSDQSQQLDGLVGSCTLMTKASGRTLTTEWRCRPKGFKVEGQEANRTVEVVRLERNRWNRAMRQSLVGQRASEARNPGQSGGIIRK